MKNDKKQFAIQYGRSLIYKSCKAIYRYIINTKGRSHPDYDVKKADIDEVLEDNNHAEIKNMWDILPRTPLYRMLAQFDIKLVEMLKDQFSKTENKSLDWYYVKISDVRI